MSTSDAFQWEKTTIAHGIFVGYLQNGTKNCDYKHCWYKFLRLWPLILQKTEFRTHFTAKTARGAYSARMASSESSSRGTGVSSCGSSRLFIVRCNAVSSAGAPPRTAGWLRRRRRSERRCGPSWGCLPENHSSRRQGGSCRCPQSR